MVRWEDTVPPGRRPDLFAVGSDNGNGQLGHVMFNTLFLREHNRVTAILRDEYPRWDAERVFETTRNILIVLLIKIVVEEYINHIAPYRFRFVLEGLRGFRDAAWFRPNRMSAEFNLLYRWHSLIPSELDVADRPLPVRDTILNPGLVREHGLGPLFEAASRQRAGRVGLFNTDKELLPFEVPSIEKGRAVQLRSYNDYREHRGFPRATAFDQITSDLRVREGLRERYGDVDEVEFYIGLFAEDVRRNSVLPALNRAGRRRRRLLPGAHEPAPRAARLPHRHVLARRMAHHRADPAPRGHRQPQRAGRPRLPVGMTHEDWRRR